MPRLLGPLESLFLAVAGILLGLSWWVHPLPTAQIWPSMAWFGAGVLLCLAVGRRGGRRWGVWRWRFFFASGVSVVLTHEKWHPNELAGVLGLYLPLAVALSLCSALDERRRSLWRLELTLLAALFGALLLATGSRGGIFSAGFAVVAVLAAGGRRGRRLLGALAVLAVVAGLTAGGDGVAEPWLFEGSVERLSAEVFFHGRFAIWNQALLALPDVGWTGLGLGAFGVAAPVLYPSAAFPSSATRTVEDAHNFYLTTALDIGLPGLALALLCIVFLVWRLLLAHRSALPGSLRQAQATGLLATLAAHLLYGLTDSVSLGSPGNVAFFFLCGLVLFSTGRPRPHRQEAAVARAVVGLVLLALLLALLFPASIQQNRAVIRASAVLVGGDPRFEEAMTAFEALGSCRSHGFLALLAERLGDNERRAAERAHWVRCSPVGLDTLAAVAQNDRRLAEIAVKTWADRPQAHLWLARSLAGNGDQKARQAAIQAYRCSLALFEQRRRGPPWNWPRLTVGRASVELGNLLAEEEPAAALEAYAEGCRQGDPGANGCFRAGRMAERLGDIEAAIEWYRRSRFSKSKERADLLATCRDKL